LVSQTRLREWDLKKVTVTDPFNIMISTSALTGSHLRTYQTIFQHPVSHNLAWLDVHALMRQVGMIEEEANGSQKVTRNGHSLVLHAQKTKDVGTTEELMVLRHFLDESETDTAPLSEQTSHVLLVIDHHEARLFGTELRGGVPERILPHKPEDFFRHAHNSKDFSRGQEKPDVFEDATQPENLELADGW
jgi:hypothetical protein